MNTLKIYLITLAFILSIKNETTAQTFSFISDTVTTESGLQYLIITKGDGVKVELNKEVAFHWTGYFQNGKSFGTSVGSEPFYFVTGKGQVIKGAEEGLSLMRVGDRYLFIMPPDLAYGEKGSGGVIPPNATLTFDYEIVSVTDPKLSINDTLLNIINKEGVNQAINLYYKLKENEYDAYSFRESELNNLGYKLISNNKLDDAIEIFKLNVKEYPDSWNVYDSLGEAYLKQGLNELALKNYQKSVEINPKNEQGISSIKKLKSSK